MKGVRKRNIGWRIDYFLILKSSINSIKNITIYKNILGSDYCPIEIEI